MPFDEEDDNDQPSLKSQKVGLKQVSTQKSIFDDMPKSPTQEDLDKTVQKIQETKSVHTSTAAELTLQFKKIVADKTLAGNKNVFQKEFELEVLKNMIKLSQEINSDIRETEGEGSLIWIILLLKICLFQRDKINALEYAVSQLDKKMNTELPDLIRKEIAALDILKKSE